MTHLTTLGELKQHITLLANIEETDAPFISCYLNLENGQTNWRDVFDERACILRRILKGNDHADFEEALGKIEAWLAVNLLPEAKGVAIFARGTFGGSFMLPMQFAAPLPNWIAVYPTPNIYHLVELKDNYHRYVVLLATPDRACILEVNLGAADTLDALRWGEVDTLVMASGYQPDPGWICTDCKAYGIETPESAVCPCCAAESVRPQDTRESILRLAEQSDCAVEVVEQSDVSIALGGIGCLLRTQLNTQIDKQTEPAVASG